MAANQDARDGVPTESMDEFMTRRQQEAAARGGRAGAAAYRAYGQAIRAGQTLALSQPSDVLAFGARLSPTNTGSIFAADSANSSSQPGSPSASLDLAQRVREATLQADTAVRAAANILTFGGADRLAAAGDALLQPGGLAGWRQRYDADLAQEQARNGYDASHRQVARTMGFGGGTVLGLAVMGPMEGALAAVPRLSGAAALTGREAAGILGAGGAAGLGMQTLSDMAGGRRWSLGDNLGAVVGGAAGAAALPLGPARAGAIDGSVTSAAQDLFNRRPMSEERAGESALVGNLFGGFAGIAGRAWSNSLSPKAKGLLGEVLGDARSTINGQRRARGPKTRDYPQEGNAKDYWYPDGRSGQLRFEDKFGVDPRLSRNQKFARGVLGSNFQLNSFVPADVGKIAGMPAGAVAPQVIDQGRRP